MIKPHFEYGRRFGFHVALSLLRYIKSPVIFEVGMMRGANEAESNGHSTKVFAHFIHMNKVTRRGGKLISVDVYEPAVTFCKEELKREQLLNDSIFLIREDATVFIKDYRVRLVHRCSISKIHLLYVDGWDYGQDSETNLRSENSTLEFIQAAEPFLANNSIILFDDVYNDNWEGKARKAIPYLLSQGWLCLFRKENQAMLIRNIFDGGNF